MYVKEHKPEDRDADEHTQVIVLEMSRDDDALLVEALKTRVSRTMSRPPVPLIRPTDAPREKVAER